MGRNDGALRDLTETILLYCFWLYDVLWWIIHPTWLQCGFVILLWFCAMSNTWMYVRQYVWNR